MGSALGLFSPGVAKILLSQLVKISPLVSEHSLLYLIKFLILHYLLSISSQPCPARSKNPAAVSSVVSDSVQPHRWQPTRLPRPWDSPGKNTGVGCHFLLQCMKVESQSEVLSCVRLFETPQDCSLPGSSSIHGIFQARVLAWGAIAFGIHCYLAITPPPTPIIVFAVESYLSPTTKSPLHQSLLNFPVFNECHE